MQGEQVGVVDGNGWLVGIMLHDRDVGVLGRRGETNIERRELQAVFVGDGDEQDVLGVERVTGEQEPTGCQGGQGRRTFDAVG